MLMLKMTEKVNLNEDLPPTVQIRDAAFEAEVLQSNQPVLIAFGVEWSQACRAFEPVLQELARAWRGNGKVVKVNADDCLYLSLFYDMQSVPTLLYFVGGNPASESSARPQKT